MPARVYDQAGLGEFGSVILEGQRVLPRRLLKEDSRINIRY